MEAARSLVAEAEADPGFGPIAFFGWTADAHERARAAVKAAVAGAKTATSRARTPV